MAADPADILPQSGPNYGLTLALVDRRAPCEARLASLPASRLGRAGVIVECSIN